MFDIREVSWAVALARFVLSLVITLGVLAGINILIYLDATNNTFDDRVAAAFRDAYDYGYAQTFDATFQQARNQAFDKGYSKGLEISQETNSSQPVSRLVETHNPTYDELMAFLAEDQTDANPYVQGDLVEGEYVCFDYAAELNNNADARGLQAAYVRLRASEWGHAVVAFETVDRGLIFIEPQSDAEVKLVIGEPYPWRQVGASSPLSATDPILQIELIW